MSSQIKHALEKGFTNTISRCPQNLCTGIFTLARRPRNAPGHESTSQVYVNGKEIPHLNKGSVPFVLEFFAVRAPDGRFQFDRSTVKLKQEVLKTLWNVSIRRFPFRSGMAGVWLSRIRMNPVGSPLGLVSSGPLALILESGRVFGYSLNHREFRDANPGAPIRHERNLMFGPERSAQTLRRWRGRMLLELPTVEQFGTDVNP
jgi:hypothetical protein